MFARPELWKLREFMHPAMLGALALFELPVWACDRLAEVML